MPQKLATPERGCGHDSKINTRLPSILSGTISSAPKAALRCSRLPLTIEDEEYHRATLISQVGVSALQADRKYEHALQRRKRRSSFLS